MTPVCELDVAGGTARPMRMEDLRAAACAQFSTFAPTDRELMYGGLSIWCGTSLAAIKAGQGWNGNCVDVTRTSYEGYELVRGWVNGTPINLKVPLTEGPW